MGEVRLVSDGNRVGMANDAYRTMQHGEIDHGSQNKTDSIGVTNTRADRESKLGAEVG